MSEILSQICRICLEDVNSCDLHPFDIFKIKQLQFLKVELKLTFTENVVICTHCTTKLQQSFDFKTAALNNFEYLSSFKQNENPVIKIEDDLLRPAVFDEIKTEVKKVCLLCLKYFEMDDLMSFDDLQENWFLNEIIDKCIPEVDFTLVSELFLCKTCMESLQNQFNLIISCFDSEKLINSYANLKNINLGEIKLHEVLKHVNKLKENSETKGGNDFFNIKEEIECLSPCPEIKIEDEEDVEDTKNDNSNKIRSLKESWPKGLKKSYPCPYCSYKSHRRPNLSSHLLVHNKLVNEPTVKFNCEFCQFNSKWRSSLLTHKLLHKNSTDLIIFKCYNCSYQTKYKKHLRRHMKLHQFKMYFCELCTYKTRIKSRLRIHKCKPKSKKFVDAKIELIKTDHDKQFEDEKQSSVPKQEYQPDEIYNHFSKIIEVDNWYYLCNTCKYKTHKMSGIKDHVLRHQKDHKEKCHLCEYQAKYKKTLKAHIKNVHN